MHKCSIKKYGFDEDEMIFSVLCGLWILLEYSVCELLSKKLNDKTVVVLRDIQLSCCYDWQEGVSG